MGEGFGDYFAGLFFERAKPERYRLSVMSWDGAFYDGDPPAVRRLDSPHTYETFDHSAGYYEHENGEIWSAALWQVRDALGRKKADRIIIDSHFQLTASRRSPAARAPSSTPTAISTAARTRRRSFACSAVAASGRLSRSGVSGREMCCR